MGEWNRIKRGPRNDGAKMFHPLRLYKQNQSEFPKPRKTQIWRKKRKTKKMEKHHVFPVGEDGDWATAFDDKKQCDEHYDTNQHFELRDLPEDNSSTLWSWSNEYGQLDDDDYDGFDTDHDGGILDLSRQPDPSDDATEDEVDNDGTYTHQWVELQPGNGETWDKDKLYSNGWVLQCKSNIDTECIDLICKVCGTRVQKNHVKFKSRSQSLETVYSQDDKLHEALSKLQMN